MHSSDYNETYYIDSKLENAPHLLGTHLTRLLACCTTCPDDICPSLSPVFVCIGSDRVTGDSLGPLIGSFLKKSVKKGVPVYGTLETPIHALNLEDTCALIRRKHPGNTVIAIDASLGSPDHQGYITVGRGSILPGAGVDKELGAIGDIFITGIIGTSGELAHLTLQTTRLSTVMAVAEQITQGILEASATFQILTTQ